ncbi:L-histidine N(alpha)-methyltransferase [Marinicellulosiphila megalodicopiae]|uniref:L-histidine N(alpha)-methyltransferase n=1 Tax=Marinicellulosiphila megalodicopiae TaxID=2724896 RepID=UPI003BB1BC62
MSLAFADLFNLSSDQLYEDVLRGLVHPKQKFIPNHYFFDTQGTTYYDEMIDSAEHYPTHCEISILHNQSDEIKEALGSNVTLFELGCQDSIKTRLLLDSLEENTHYIAIDSNQESLINHVDQLNCIYSSMTISAFEQNYFETIYLPEKICHKSNKVIFIAGSHICNLAPEKAVRFLRNLKKQFKNGTKILIGHDLPKAPNILEAAYNDKKGCAARFNLNLLSRINRELKSDFDLSSFQHRVIYNQQQKRVETHLVSLAHQSVNINGHKIYFTKGESILTQNIYKYNHLQFTQLLSEAGWKSIEYWGDSKGWYNLQLAKC